MKNPSITRAFEVDTGHRLMKHGGKCRNPHGHRYRFEVSFALKDGSLDDVGCVVDFGVLKELVGGWLDKAFDHGFVLQVGDPLIHALAVDEQAKCCVIDVPPSIENFVKIVFKGAAEEIALPYPGVEVVHVRGYETPSCWADWPPLEASKATDDYLRHAAVPECVPPSDHPGAASSVPEPAPAWRELARARLGRKLAELSDAVIVAIREEDDAHIAFDKARDVADSARDAHHSATKKLREAERELRLAQDVAAGVVWKPS